MSFLSAYYRPPTHGIPVGRYLRKTCAAKEVQLKEAALIAELDFPTLSRGIHELGVLDLNRLVALPTRILRKWFKLIVLAKEAREWETDTVEERKRA